jgi:hypothetical protein
VRSKKEKAARVLAPAAAAAAVALWGIPAIQSDKKQKKRRVSPLFLFN